MRSSQFTTARPTPAPQPRQLVGRVVDRRHEGRDAQPGQREAGERGGHRRQRQRRAQPSGGQRTTGLHDPALAEPVDGAVAGEPADVMAVDSATKPSPATAGAAPSSSRR